MRTLIIGDIHGAYKALMQVLGECDPQHDDTLIFLGDYVDGWSQSYQVIDYLLELNRHYKCIFIKGNHDAWCEEWLTTGKGNPIWLANGGISTVESYSNANKATKREHLKFFNHLHDYYIDDENNLFVHAGFSSMHGPKREPFSSNFYWDRTLWEVALALNPKIPKSSKHYPKRLKLFNEIFIGHTSTTNYGTVYDIDEPMNLANLWNVDTGAGTIGRISVLDLKTKNFWQSDIVQTLYPTEKGRN